jgi:Tfp pilus assembly protein PilO
MLTSQLQTEKIALAKSQKALGEIKVFQDSLETQRGIIQALKTQLEQMQNQLPVEPQGTEVIRELTTISENINMRKRVINPAPEVVNTDFVIEKFKIEGELTYIQLIVFLEQLMKTGRIYDMDEINVSTIAGNKNTRYNYLRFNASLQTFRFNGS